MAQKKTAPSTWTVRGKRRDGMRSIEATAIEMRVCVQDYEATLPYEG